MQMKLPNPRMVTSFLVSLALIIYCATVANSVGRQNKPARITAMKVSTLDSEGGKLAVSEDLFVNQSGSSPVRAGNGSGNYPEHHLLVLVQVTGNTDAKVELQATEGRKLVWSKVSQPFYEKLGADTEDINNPRRYVIFFIEGERCQTLKLTARLVGQRQPSSMSRTIEFSCGE